MTQIQWAQSDVREFIILLAIPDSRIPSLIDCFLQEKKPTFCKEKLIPCFPRQRNLCLCFFFHQEAGRAWRLSVISLKTRKKEKHIDVEGVVSCNLLCRSSPKVLEIFGSFARPKTTVSGSIKWPLCVLVIAVLLPWIGWGKRKKHMQTLEH